MKRYVFELVITEGSDEFWESIANKSGCDEVTEAITSTLDVGGWFVGDGTELTLKAYTNTTSLIT